MSPEYGLPVWASLEEKTRRDFAIDINPLAKEPFAGVRSAAQDVITPALRQRFGIDIDDWFEATCLIADGLCLDLVDSMNDYMQNNPLATQFEDGYDPTRHVLRSYFNYFQEQRPRLEFINLTLELLERSDRRIEVVGGDLSGFTAFRSLFLEAIAHARPELMDHELFDVYASRVLFDLTTRISTWGFIADTLGMDKWRQDSYTENKIHEYIESMIWEIKIYPDFFGPDEDPKPSPQPTPALSDH